MESLPRQRHASITKKGMELVMKRFNNLVQLQDLCLTQLKVHDIMGLNTAFMNGHQISLSSPTSSVMRVLQASRIILLFFFQKKYILVIFLTWYSKQTGETVT